MKIRLRRMWKKYKAGDETDAIPDGIATTLIRIGAAALVEDKADVSVPIETHNEDEPADSSDGTDERTSDAGGSEETTVSGGVGHKSGRRANKTNSGSSGTVGT